MKLCLLLLLSEVLLLKNVLVNISSEVRREVKLETISRSSETLQNVSLLSMVRSSLDQTVVML